MNRNLTLLTDFYELTMMQGYFERQMSERVVFDLYYRKNPDGGGYSIFAGLEQAIEYVKNLRFDEDALDYLASTKQFSAAFLDYLRDLRFTGDIWSVPEGTVVFPNEPLVRVTAPLIEAQLVETAFLNILNHQTLIATKASRVMFAADGDMVLEFGLRRAQGPDAGVFGSRAAYIGGCQATSNVLAGQLFGIPVRGTHAHSWVMSFPNEYEAFKAYATSFPDACTLLVDTYDTLRSGVPNAIRVFTEFRDKNPNARGFGIRLDSGDLSYLSKKARQMLDEAGFPDATITASNDLDEYLIQSLKIQGSKIGVWGVGTNLITSKHTPAFGGVYKLCAQEQNGVFVPKIKISDNPEKINNPGIKKIFRLYDKSTGKIKADLIALDNETIDETLDLEIFDPLATWKRMVLESGEYTARELLIPVVLNGEIVHETPHIRDIRAYCQNELNTLWGEHRRFENPHSMPVDLSQALYDMKKALLEVRRSK